jgi:hypothetical protein
MKLWHTLIDRLRKQPFDSHVLLWQAVNAHWSSRLALTRSRVPHSKGTKS